MSQLEREKFVKQLKDLVAIPNFALETGPNVELNAKALDLIETWIDPSLEKKRIKNGNAEILLIGNGDLLNPEVGYMVHTDVVSGSEKMFSLQEKDGKLFGRGVSDMKYSIPLGISLLNELKRSVNSRSMTIAITTDEEIGGGEGGKYLAENLKFRPKVLIVPDGGDGLVFVNKSKGVAHIWIESEGKSSHASKPWEGQNAIDPLIKVAASLIEKYGENSKVKNWKTTMNLGFMKGGVSTNQVADSAILKIDFRFPEIRTPQEVFEETQDLAKKINPDLKITLPASGEATFTDTANPEVKKFLKIVESVIGREVKIEGEEGASDARYFAKFDIPIFMIKPDGGDIHHETEWIDIDSCIKFYNILWKYIAG